MDWSDTLQNVLLLGGGAVALKVIEYISDLTKGLLGRRRTELDRLGQDLALAIAERDRETLLRRKTLEVVWVLRGMMIRSGHWALEDIPDEPKRED